MIVLIIKDSVGPGNQMFMLARAYSLAKEYGHKILIISEMSGYSYRQNILQKFKLDKRIVKGFFRIDWKNNNKLFRYAYKITRKILFDFVLRSKLFYQINQEANDSRTYRETIDLKKFKTYIVDGYWECYKYFEKYRNELAKQFVPNYLINSQVRKLLKKVQSSNSVAIHIRNWDFKEWEYRSIDNRYYDAAIKKIRELIPNPLFFMICENESIAKKYETDKDIILVNLNTENKYLDEWYLLSQCKYHIISNSTYSWWSSFV